MATDVMDVRILTAIHTEGSYRQAATRLKMDQATVSRRMATLEDSVGVQLFIKDRKGVRLTEDGQTLLGLADRAVKSMDAFDRSLERISVVRAGNVKINCPPALCAYILAPAFTRIISDTHPLAANEQKIDWKEMPYFSFVSQGVPVADIEISWSKRGHAPATGNHSITERIGATPMLPYGSEAYFKSRARPKRFSDLHEHDIIDHELYATDEYLEAWNVELARSAVGPRMKLACLTSIIPVVSGGGGTGLIPTLFSPIVPNLVPAFLSDCPYLARDLWISSTPEALKSPVVKRVYDAVIEILRVPPWVERR
ncbi:LysR family transcriptional regulator [Thalassospira xiamenensis]|uniref:DNA-binding transcriptional regulator, LysR family n=1 Tax=Thalassospira xiamenensis TaxID=220697 RepID=A0A285TX05_9PROT|nr:LysR family transcriptional regulator [Thalassospira xiamenensis]SOC26722.1 DNA-binding transcriptional regulator, LysR family [Thalassospira xiamenensis]